MTGAVPSFDRRGVGPPAAPAPPGAVLAGDSPHGPIVVSVRLGRDLPRAGGALGHALHAAAAELHIAFLEWWLDAFLELRPAPAARARLPTLFSIGDDDGDVAVEVALPGASWATLPALGGPANEAGWRLRWTPCRSSLLLEDIALSGEDAARVVPGATVLLPRSFETTWPARLVADRSRAAIEGRYDPHESLWHASSGTDRAEPLTVPTAGAGAVPARVWSCGTAPASLFVANDSPGRLEIGPGRSRTSCLLALGGERWFGGHLLPVAAGFGLSIAAPLRARGPAAASGASRRDGSPRARRAAGGRT